MPIASAMCRATPNQRRHNAASAATIGMNIQGMYWMNINAKLRHSSR
jgi:hypothetical protein